MRGLPEQIAECLKISEFPNLLKIQSNLKILQKSQSQTCSACFYIGYTLYVDTLLSVFNTHCYTSEHPRFGLEAGAFRALRAARRSVPPTRATEYGRPAGDGHVAGRNGPPGHRRPQRLQLQLRGKMDLVTAPALRIFFTSE